MQLINKTKNTILAYDAAVADNPYKRVIGLLNRKEFKKGQALIIKPCQSIHTFFMRFPIDALFIDKEGRVIKTIAHLKPWRLTGVYFSAQACIELPVGTMEASLTSEGDLISF